MDTKGAARGKMMGFVFMLDRTKENGFQLIVTAAAPQRTSDIQLFVRKQAGTKLPIGSQTQAVARMAEMPAHGLNKSDFSPGAFESISLCRAIHAFSIDRNQVT